MTSEYLLAYVPTDMMNFAQKRLTKAGIPHCTLHVVRDQPLTLEDASVDVIVSFHSPDHLYLLRPYLEKMKRVLKPGGTLIDALPAEAASPWGEGE